MELRQARTIGPSGYYGQEPKLGTEPRDDRAALLADAGQHIAHEMDYLAIARSNVVKTFYQETE